MQELLLGENLIRDVVCTGLCRYHKPGKADEPGCGGLVRLARDGVSPTALANAARDESGGDALWGMPADAPLLLDVCASCDYFVDGCDFRDPLVPREDCSPCGGLRAVALLASQKAGV